MGDSEAREQGVNAGREVRLLKKISRDLKHFAQLKMLNFSNPESGQGNMPIYLEIVPFLTSPITEGKVLAYTTIILFGWSVLLHIVCFSGVPLLLSLSKNSNRSTRQAVLPPTAPYSIPYWNHTRAYVSGREKYASTLM